MTDVNNEEIQIEAPLSIGERLRLAREAKNITIPEVSSQLRLVRENISFLETGQWGKLHGRAYARGYLISYVKFLGLSEEEFLVEFNREYETSELETPLSNNVARLIENKGFPWFKVLLILLLAVITWFAYQQWLQYESELVTEENLAVETVEPVAETNSFSSSVVEAIIPTEQISDENSNNAVLPIIEQAVEATPEVVAEPTEIVVENIANDQNIKIVEAEVIAEVNPIPPADSETNIELNFSEDCWVNVTDAKGHILLNKVMNANTNIELSGQAPLSLSLGRASAVTMKVNKADFDLAPHIRGDVAKFTLGAES